MSKDKVKSIEMYNIANLRVKARGVAHYLTAVDIQDEIWSIMPVDEEDRKRPNVRFEAGCGAYNLGQHESPFDAFMAVIGDMGCRWT